jgi:hypothetical protein
VIEHSSEYANEFVDVNNNTEEGKKRRRFV